MGDGGGKSEGAERGEGSSGDGEGQTRVGQGRREVHIPFQDAAAPCLAPQAGPWFVTSTTGHARWGVDHTVMGVLLTILQLALLRHAPV